MFRSSAAIAHWDTWGFYASETSTFWAFSLVTEISPGEATPFKPYREPLSRSPGFLPGICGRLLLRRSALDRPWVCIPQAGLMAAPRWRPPNMGRTSSRSNDPCPIAGSFEKQLCPGSTLPDGSPAVCSGWQGTGAVWRSADFNTTKATTRTLTLTRTLTPTLTLTLSP